MIYERYGHALVPIYDAIFAVGGYFHSDILGAKPLTTNTVEMFKFESEDWIEVVSMNEPRAFFGACPVAD